jgi:medium-chain acyl-[acyl-carrier-protein] hydrolase
MPPESPWLIRYQPPPQASRRLFCFPYAGGAASLFRTWQAELASDIEVCAVQLPGRETRYAEAPRRMIGQLVDELVEVLPGWLDKPYAIFGHSMGAAIGFEVQLALQELGLPPPSHFFASGHRAPDIPDPDPPLHHLTGDAFVDALRRFSGTPEQILQHPEMMALFGPLLRADLELDHTYLHRHPPALPCPVSVLGGDQDAIVPLDHLHTWQPLAKLDFDLQIFEGDHFFLKDQVPALATYIKSRWPPDPAPS